MYIAVLVEAVPAGQRILLVPLLERLDADRADGAASATCARQYRTCTTGTILHTLSSHKLASK